MATYFSILAWRIPWKKEPVRLLCPWDSPGKKTEVGCHALLQGTSRARDRTHSSCISSTAGEFFTGTPPGKPSNPITSWQIQGKNVETVTDLIFLGSKITADGDYSHEIKSLILGRKAVSNLDSTLKSRDITLLTKICIVKAVVFPVVMYGCEIRTIKKAECWKIDAFKLWC